MVEDTDQQQTNIQSNGDVNNKEQSTDVWTDYQFEVFLTQELNQHPLAKEYPDLFNIAPKLICKWRQRYRGNKSLWKRLFDKDKVTKEFIEAVPFIDAIQKLVINSELKNGEKYTIIDLACGRGYLSMILSELLPPDKVEKIVLVDKQWSMHSMTPTSQHISWTHIYGSFKACEDQTIPSYYETWPISLNTSCVNLKKSREIKSMEKRLFSNGPVILVAVHLCGTLSLKAVELFNNNPKTKFLLLKPCCLPGMVHAKRDEIFQLGSHSFDSKLVCQGGKWRGNKWKGPSRQITKQYFERWSENLFLGINNEDAVKVKKTVMVQHQGGYQNEFLFAERTPKTTSVWDELKDEQSSSNMEVEDCAATD